MKREKIHNLLLFILIFFSILSIIIIKPINDLDELWNYNFARNIKNGLVPYRDFNMLQMPLLPIICGILLKLTFDELIVMRILATLLCSIIVFITYKLFMMLNIKKEISIIFTFIIGYIFKDIYCIDYNYASLLLVLLIILNEIKLYKRDNIFLKCDRKTDILLGILAGMTLTLKQTTGLFVCIAFLGNKLLFLKNKEELKIYLKSFAYRLLGIAIPIILMTCYLIINGAILDCINYTIKGISGFSNYISYKTLLNFDLLGVLSVLVPITFVYTWIKTIVFEKDKISYVFFVYGLAMFVVCFPISNKIHFLIGALPIIILILNNIYNLCKKIFNKFLNKNKYIIFSVLFILTFLEMFIILKLVYNCSFNFYNYSKLNYSDFEHYKNIPVISTMEEKIKKVNEYIYENKDVKILDATASVYMIPISRYNKNYDMLLKGNLGHKGEEKIIEEIKKSKDTRYLILKDEFGKNWQTPLDIIDYVKENKSKVGEIEIFDIYK